MRRTLDFDIETRKIGFHSAGRFAPDGCEITSIAWSWVGDKRVNCVQRDVDAPIDLSEFIKAWDEADIVSGHYVLKFDIPVIQGHLLENGLPPLTPKLVSDTKTHLVSRAGLSASQENLAGLYGLAEQKFHMADYMWRESTRLTPDGIEQTRRRVIDDVKQHKALRAALLEQGFLRPPRLWRP